MDVASRRTYSAVTFRGCAARPFCVPDQRGNISMFFIWRLGNSSISSPSTSWKRSCPWST